MVEAVSEGLLVARWRPEGYSLFPSRGSVFTLEAGEGEVHGWGVGHGEGVKATQEPRLALWRLMVLDRRRCFLTTVPARLSMLVGFEGCGMKKYVTYNLWHYACF